MATRKDINTFISGKGFPSFDADFGWVYEDVDTGKRYRQATSPRGKLWKILKMSPEVEAEIILKIEEGNFLTSVTVDGTTIIGDGTPSSPLSAPGIGGETLAQTLAIGNLTGGNNIIISDGNVITGSGGQIHQDFGNDLAWILTTDGGVFGTPYIVANPTSIELASLGGGGLLLVAGSTSLAHSTLLNLISPQVDVSSLAGAGDGFVLVDNAGTISTGLVSVDGVSITGDGTIANPLISTGAGFVPYTGATADVQLGLFTLQADSLLINDSANNNTLNLLSGENLTADRILRIIVNDADRILTIAADSTISNTNTGDQISIVGISGTMAQFDTACSDGNFLYESDLAAGVQTWLATPSSANLATAVTDETGSGLLVFNNSPTFIDDITVGTAGTGTGQIFLRGTTSGTVTLSVADAAGTWTMKLPVNDGNNLDVLQTDGSGNTSWVPQAGASGANTALSNLAAVAINADLDPGADNVRELGNASFQWNGLYLGDSGFILWNGSMGSIQVNTSTMVFDNATQYQFAEDVVPKTTNVGGLGTASLQWEDLFLSEGGTINWDNGDAVMTQTGNDISFTSITSFGLGTSTVVTLGTIELGAASDTTIARVSAGLISVEGKTVLTNTTTSGVGTSPTASQTDTITHNLLRTPTIIRIYGMSNFVASGSALPPVHSIGVFNSTGNRCLYQPYDGVTITAAEPAATSTTFAIRLDTGVGNFITGVIQNVTSTQFDIVWTETGTATAQSYLWEAQ